MKKLLLLYLILGAFQITSSQPTGMLNETFNLKSIETNDIFYTPNGENPSITISEGTGNYLLEANGIVNHFSSEVTFTENTLTFQSLGITLLDCNVPNCYYEDLYFFEVLTNINLDYKTLSYNFWESNGFKYFYFKDADNNFARFSNEPTPEVDPKLFQTWYLYRTEVDGGGSTIYNGPGQSRITINPDFTYTGSDGCALISGDFILGNGNTRDFILQPQNYNADTTNCPPGPISYLLYDLEYKNPLDSWLLTNTGGVDEFIYETSPGFLSYFSNSELLSVNDENIADLAIYPNPAKDKLNIQTAIANFNAVTVSDVNGRIVISILNSDSKEMDISALKSGMYFLNIATSEGTSTKKFIKL